MFSRRTTLRRSLSQLNTRARLELLEDRSVPATFTVTSFADGPVFGPGILPGSLRQAIFDANALAGTDDVVFAPAVFKAGAAPIFLMAGEIAATESVNIKGTSAPFCDIKVLGMPSRIFNLNVTGKVSTPFSISNLKLEGGTAPAGPLPTDGIGGAIVTPDEAVTITGCDFETNTAAKGGGALGTISEAGSFTVTSTKFMFNSAVGGGGGAIYASDPATITLTGCTLVSNSAAGGGAIAFPIGGTLKATNCLISGNMATSSAGGGAVFFDGGFGYGAGVSFINCTLSSNKATAGPGGAMALLEHTQTALFQNSTLSGNSAATDGGAILMNSVSSGTLLVQNSTITANSAGGAGPGIAQLNPTAGTVTLASSIVADNPFPGPMGDITALNRVFASHSAVGNLPMPGGPGMFFFIAKFVDQNNNLPPGIPLMLGSLGSNGGSVTTHKLMPGSPCIDRGSNPAGLTTDGRGTGFVRVLGPQADIGAYEAVTDDLPVASLDDITPITTTGGTKITFTVTYFDATAINVSTLDSGDLLVFPPTGPSLPVTFKGVNIATDGSPRTATYEVAAPGGVWDVSKDGFYTIGVVGSAVADTSGNFVMAGPIGGFNVTIGKSFVVTNDLDVGPGSLRDAVDMANKFVSVGDTITFDPLFFTDSKSIMLGSGEIAITDNVTITGPGSKLATITSGGFSRAFKIDGTTSSSKDANLTVAISGLTFSGNTAADYGGAIKIADEFVTITDSIFTANSSSVTGGGAIGLKVAGAKLTLVNDTFFSNSTTGSADGGALYFAGGGSALSIQSTSFTDNFAGDDGGAIVLNGGITTIVNSSLTGNKSGLASTSNGGAIAVVSFVGGSLTLINSTLADNTAGGNGGGIFDSSGVALLLQNSTVSKNSAMTGTGGGLSVTDDVPAFGVPTLTIESSIVSGNMNMKAPDIYSVPAVPAKIGSSAIGSPLGFTLITTAPNLAFGVDLKLSPPVFLGPMPTMAICFLAYDSPAVNKGSNPTMLTTDQRGTGFPRVVGTAADIGAYEVQPAAKVASVTINDGSAQRSRITSVTLVFDQLVGVPGSAFKLMRQSDSALVDLTVTPTYTTVTTANLTFTGALSEGTSLMDGRYTLTIDPTMVGNINGSLDGDGNGIPGGTYTFASAPSPMPPTNIFRLFGDSNGDGTVAANDFIAFRLALGGTSATFDFDNDGAVAASDFIQFRLRFGGSI